MRKRQGLTRLKLDEAAFFLSHLKPNFHKERKFDYFLSAFISAARSIAWAMSAEYGKSPGFRQWYDELKRNEEEERVLKGTTNLRNRTQKSGGLRTMSKVIVSGLSMPGRDKSMLSSVIERSRRGAIPIKVGGSGGNYTLTLEVEGEPIVIAARGARLKRELSEFPGEDVLAICQKYFEMMKRQVVDCERRFDA